MPRPEKYMAANIALKVWWKLYHRKCWTYLKINRSDFPSARKPKGSKCQHLNFSVLPFSVKFL
jgi:hypothetical protein